MLPLRVIIYFCFVLLLQQPPQSCGERSYVYDDAISWEPCKEKNCKTNVIITKSLLLRFLMENHFILYYTYVALRSTGYCVILYLFLILQNVVDAECLPAFNSISICILIIEAFFIHDYLLKNSKFTCFSETNRMW